MTDISIHHTVTDWGEQSAADELETLRKIGEFHTQSRGWPGFAYPLVVFPSGNVYLTGGLDTIRYVVGEHNAQNIAIAIVGDFTYEPPTDLAIEGARLTFGELRFELGRPAPGYGHRDTPGAAGTECPGKTYESWLPRIVGEPVALAEETATNEWSREDIIASIINESDAASIPHRLLLGATIAESSLDQYAAREGDWPDVSYGLGQQTVRYAPVGDQSDTPENRALVRDWLFNPANAIPLMAGKLAASFHSDDNPGTTEGDRIMASLARYNSGSWAIPASHAANVDNYRRALTEADRILEAHR